MVPCNLDIFVAYYLDDLTLLEFRDIVGIYYFSFIWCWLPCNMFFKQSILEGTLPIAAPPLATLFLYHDFVSSRAACSVAKEYAKMQ